MNCTECQTDPLTPGHYCPCCGRKLSLQEQRAAGLASPECAAALDSATVAEPSRDWTPPVEREAAALDNAEVTLPPPVVAVDEARIAKAKAVADETAKAHLAKAANPVPVTRRPIVPAPAATQSRSRTPMLTIAAAVIVGAIGAAEGARRFGFDWLQRDARDAQPVQAVSAAETALPAIPSATNVVAANRASEMAPVRAVVKPKTRTPIAQRAPVRQANSPAQQVAPAVARTSAPETPAPAPPTPSAPVTADSARPPSQLTGKLFDSTDVDEPPRIATRVEPRLPANLPAGADKKIVVARVLVSRTGQPHHVSLLRGSMLGRAADEAVVAAVKQWTFSPARKRGEAVNCWYNIGVPLAQAD